MAKNVTTTSFLLFTFGFSIIFARTVKVACAFPLSFCVCDEDNVWVYNYNATFELSKIFF